MKKIGYILAAIYAVFSLSVTSFALPEIIQGAEDAVDTVASDVEGALGGSDATGGDDDDPTEADTSDNGDDPVESSDDPADTSDDPEESSDTSDTEPDVSSSDDAATTTAPTEVGNAGSTQNPATGVVLGCTALGLAAAGLTAAAARKRK